MATDEAIRRLMEAEREWYERGDSWVAGDLRTVRPAAEMRYARGVRKRVSAKIIDLLSEEMEREYNKRTGGENDGV